MRKILFSAFFLMSAHAQALDLFDFFANALHAGKSNQAVQANEESDSWANAIVIDLSGKKSQQQIPSSQTSEIVIKPGQTTTQVPTQTTQLPAPAPTPAPAPAPVYEVIKPKVFVEKTEHKAPVPEWKEDKKVHWEAQVKEYYSNYLGSEMSMPKTERETKLQENAVFFDPNKAASLDLNKYVMPLDGKSTTGKTNIKWRLEPMFYFNADLEHKIKNLTPYQARPDDPRPTFTSGKILLQPAGASDYGYQVHEKATLGIGGGAGLQSVIDWKAPTFSSFATILQPGVFVGALAIINKVETTDRKVLDPKADKLTYDVALPALENILNKWDVGQSFSYSLSGGFMLTAGVDFMAIAVGPTFVKVGTAEQVVTKIAPNKVMVEVTKLDTTSGAATITAGIASYSQILKNDIERTKETYFYDLSMEAGRRAFGQIMIGNYYDTQELIRENQTVAVAMVERDINRTYMDKGDFGRAWYVGIPFIYWNWTKGKQTNEGYLQNFANSVESRYYHGVYYDNFHRRLIRLHKTELEMFYTGVENPGKAPMINATEQDYYARYVFNLQDETMTRGNLRSELNEMIYFRTGLEELDVNELNLNKNLGYGNVEVIMDFDKYITDALFLHLEGGGSDLYSAMNRAIDDFAKTDYPEKLDICDTLKYNAYRDMYSGEHSSDIAAAKIKGKADCVAKIRANTRLIIKDMSTILGQMYKLSRATDDDSKKEFAKQYREFGRLMMTDRFTFRTIYNLLVDDRVGDFVRYTINGEKMANMVIYFPSGKIGAANSN